MRKDMGPWRDRVLLLRIAYSCACAKCISKKAKRKPGSTKPGIRQAFSDKTLACTKKYRPVPGVQRRRRMIYANAINMCRHINEVQDAKFFRGRKLDITDGPPKISKLRIVAHSMSPIQRLTERYVRSHTHMHRVRISWQKAKKYV